MRLRACLALLLIGCSSAAASEDEATPSGDDAQTSSSTPASSPDPTAAPSDPSQPADPAACPTEVIVTATEAGEHSLVVDASSIADTAWGEKGNEAVVLEVMKGQELVGHLVLHQGKMPFSYGMHAGALVAGDTLTIRPSKELSAKNVSSIDACIMQAKLAKADSEGVANAPILKWPREKSFDDLPVLVGWSKKNKSYQVAYTNENGGTVAQCGGGAKGLRSEIARWGRALDLEGAYSYGGGPKFERCTGSATPRMEAAHPIVYYGDGHNRLFESRGGYGQACGTGSDARADGNLQGWNTNNPGNEASKDDPYTIVLRPLPVDLDAVPGRESIVDRYAPWLYRLTWSEVEREGRVDGSMVLPLDRYLFVDVYAGDVGGSGDATCGFPFPNVSGGFVLRAVTKSGVVSNGPQMTQDFFGGTLKRIAIPLASGVKAADIAKLVFDAYDDDGIFWLALGDAFVVHPDGRNGAKIEFVNQGKKPVNVYVDDGNDGCVSGKNATRGDGVAYPCTGSSYTLPL